ncbi:M20/M25/M40 family metallo-hydrolase [candidate division KSB1 bacterium]|nr:M20/M25/M40 family metallo-hydrolase [candidate division KSB1 bacterium]
MLFMIKSSIVLLFVAVIACYGQGKILPFLAANDSIKQADLLTHLSCLGDDSLQGRATGSEGEKLAAEYIVSQLTKCGIKPLSEKESYFQTIPMHSSMPLASSELTLFGDKTKETLSLEKDYVLYKSGAQTFIPNPVPLVFVGYGIIAPEWDYNDYQSVNVQGKIVVYLEGEPTSTNPNYFMGNTASIYSYLESKQRLAISRGARGSIVIPNPRINPHKTWQDWQRAYCFEEITLAYSVASHFSMIINPEKSAILFQNASFSLEDVYKMDRKGVIQSFQLRKSLSFRGQFEERDFFSNNIAGIIHGSDLKLGETYLLLSAHYDHLGIGKPAKGDSIYNGVFDNAAGVAALLEIGDAIQNMNLKPRRSVILLFLTGEEKGILGSSYYIDHPLVPLHKTIANINIDGLAMFDTFNDIVGIGADLSDLGIHFSSVSQFMGLTVSQIPSQFLRTESFARSDQIAFAKAGIPAMLTMEGLDYRCLSREEALDRIVFWLTNIYHTPFDDLDQYFDIQASLQHTRFLFAFTWYLANLEEEIKWKPGVSYNTARLQSIAEER